ncbi:hypothetical protein H4Q26_008526 [Puccinia striiformis f. sp. tritici PST-130]|nr:hypothetical protein H4Q26_008526 [Puccinia striiformis f. sp. tritici PST-130]
MTPKQADDQPAFESGAIHSGLISNLSASEWRDGIGKEIITRWERRFSTSAESAHLKTSEGCADRATGAMDNVVNELLPPFQNLLEGRRGQDLFILELTEIILACLPRVSWACLPYIASSSKHQFVPSSQSHYVIFEISDSFGDDSLQLWGCATIIGHDFQGLPNKWQIKHAYKTEGHKQLWNCLGTGMEISICCLNGKIVIPPKANPRVMTIEGFDPGYGNICGDSSPLDKNSPGVKDCI